MTVNYLRLEGQPLIANVSFRSERCASSDQKFLRAWSLDGYWRLAQAHDRLRPRALELFEQGARDPAAAVKARVRNIRRDMEKGAWVR